MTRVSITAANLGGSKSMFRAAARGKESVGATPGAALDALTEQLTGDETNTLVIVQSNRPDSFFTDAQQKRLKELLTERRTALENGTQLDPAKTCELESLIEAELDGAAQRAAAMIDELRP